MFYQQKMQFEKEITRFAPSPTGRLHLGHAFSALFAQKEAEKRSGRVLLRMENIDKARCKTEYEAHIREDLRWLGFDWNGEIRRQSDHIKDYKIALQKLQEIGVLYPCFCSRSEILKEIENSFGAPHNSILGPDGPTYPGTCRSLTPDFQSEQIASGKKYGLRLDVRKSLNIVGEISWFDVESGETRAEPEIFGDIILARKDVMTSYHLSCTVDDNIQGVSLVTRAEDLTLATHIHRLLQQLLDYKVPEYKFHKIIVDENGDRLAKRVKSKTIYAMRKEGLTASDIRLAVGL